MTPCGRYRRLGRPRKYFTATPDESRPQGTRPPVTARILRGWRRVAPAVMFGSNQILVQIIAAIAGFLVVRALTKQEYAAYAVVVAVAAAMGMVAEGGLGGAFLARFKQYESDLDSYYSAARLARLRLSTLLSACSFAVLIVLLHGLNGQWRGAIALALLGAIAMLLNAHAALYVTFAQGRLLFRTVRRYALTIAVMRLMGMAGLVAAPWTGAFFAVGVSIISIYVSACYLRRRLDVPKKISASPLHKAYFRQAMYRIIPVNVGLVLYSQTLYVLLSLRGEGEILADLAALARFEAPFAILIAVLLNVGIPTLVQAADRRRAFIAMAGVSLLACTGALALLVGARGILLPLLGPQYDGLETPYLIVMCGAAAYCFTECLNFLSQGMSWLKGSWTFFPLCLIWIALMISVGDVESRNGAAFFSASLFVPALLANIVRIACGLRASSEWAMQDSAGSGTGLLSMPATPASHDDV